jgi:hypothetical protein
MRLAFYGTQGWVRRGRLGPRRSGTKTALFVPLRIVVARVRADAFSTTLNVSSNRANATTRMSWLDYAAGTHACD